MKDKYARIHPCIMYIVDYNHVHVISTFLSILIMQY